MGSKKRCGTCEHFTRSTFPGLISFGKCPHREGVWLRTNYSACDQHKGEPKSKTLNFVMIANLMVMLFGFTMAISLDIMVGNWITHILFAIAFTGVAIFGYLIYTNEAFNEEAKYIIFNEDDTPPEDKDKDFFRF